MTARGPAQPRHQLSLWLVIVTLAVSTACGDGEGSTSPTTTNRLDAAVFSTFPHPQGSAPHTDGTSIPGAIVRSYRADDESPRAIVEFYRDHLPGWWPKDDLTRLVGPAFKARWLRPGQELTVTASAIAPSEAGVARGAASLYSLALRHGPQLVPASVTVSVNPGRGVASREATLECGREPSATGFLVDQALEACRALGARQAALTPPAPGRVCAQRYGGPQTAVVRGTVAGQPLDRALDRTDSCGIADWAALRPLLGRD